MIIVTTRIIFSFLILCSFFNGTTQDIEWEENYGGSSTDEFHSMDQTNDDGYVVTGRSLSSDGDVGNNYGSYDVWVLKLGAAGNIEWEKNYGGSSPDHGRSIEQTVDGGYVVAGYTASSDGDVDNSNGSGDYWVVKLDATGNIEWEENYGGSSADYANSIKQTADSGYVVAGDSFSSDGDVGGNYGYRDYWVVKLDATGNIEWEENYGGSAFEWVRSIRQTADSGYVVIGSSFSSDGDVDNNKGGEDYWVVKLDAAGNIEWEESYGGSSTDEARSIEEMADGGYIVAGNSSSSNGDVGNNNGNGDYWVVKLDASGNIEWEENYGGPAADYANSIKQTIDSGYIVAGRSRFSGGDVSNNNGGNDYWVLKLDVKGNIEWEENYGGSTTDKARSIVETADSSYVVAGYSESSDGDIGSNNGGFDFYKNKSQE